ncbi:MAG: hypothetical protein LUQ01_02735 [Methanolinea sp.]|nr:hypothetical protein [Methanolinea sp.]
MTQEKDEQGSAAGSKEEKEEPLFDLLIPPGVPQKLMADIVNNFEVEVVVRKQRLYFANMDGDERDLLAFRGKREVVEKVEKYMIAELKKFIGE